MSNIKSKKNEMRLDFCFYQRTLTTLNFQVQKRNGTVTTVSAWETGQEGCHK